MDSLRMAGKLIDLQSHSPSLKTIPFSQPAGPSSSGIPSRDSYHLNELAGREGHSMRKVLIAIAVIIVVVIAGAAIFVATFDVNKYRGTIQTQLQQHLGRPVQLGEMHLKLFPPSITVQNLAIADDPRFSSDAPFVKANELDVAVKLLPLLHKDVEIQSLNLQQPTVNLIKNKADQWNFSSFGSGTTSSTSQSSNQQFSLGDLLIKDGEISLLDQTQRSTPSLYNHIDVKLSDFE